MQLQMQDRVSLGDVRITGDGYLVATPRVARMGIQIYAGREVGRPDLDQVRVYRPEGEVFDKASMHTFAVRPITDDHPPEQVTALNWRKYSVGASGEDVARDGESLRVPMVVMDQAVIKKVQDGKAELSVGYMCDLKWETGTDPTSGQQYDAVQTSIRANHIAIVKSARGGEKLRIGDASAALVNHAAVTYAKALIDGGKVDRKDGGAMTTADNVLGYLVCDEQVGQFAFPFIKDGTVFERGLKAAYDESEKEGNKPVADAAKSLLDHLTTSQQGANQMADKSKVIGGITVTLSDTAAEAIDLALKAKDAEIENFKKKSEEEEAAKKKAETDAAVAATAAKSASDTKDAEIATLKKQLEDAKLTPEKLNAMVKDRHVTITKGKVILGDAAKLDDKSDDDIRKEVVMAKMGDAAKDWSVDAIRASFDTLTAGVQVTSNIADQRQAFSTPQLGGNHEQNMTKVYAARDQKLQDAWKGEPAGKA